jgi:predicted GH43/DUF377 family glycosyl hydrolase
MENERYAILDRNGKNDVHWTAMLHNKGTFYMFYNFGMASSGPAPYMTGLAISQDGIDFKIEKDVVFGPEVNKWDGNMMEVHSIIRANSTWRMYYCGLDDHWRIGYAESEDLKNWKRNPNPILDIGDKYWENIHVADPYVIFFKGKYFMYYMGKGHVWQVGVAISHDGIEWNKYPENPIIMATEDWCDGCVCLSGVIIYNGKLLAAVHGYNTKTSKFITKLMSSDNGIHWRYALKDEKEIVIEPGEWSNRGIVHPDIVATDGKLYIYYTGIKLGIPNEHRVELVILDDKNLLL